jgi:uncharacterized protein YkwD
MLLPLFIISCGGGDGTLPATPDSGGTSTTNNNTSTNTTNTNTTSANSNTTTNNTSTNTNNTSTNTNPNTNSTSDAGGHTEELKYPNGHPLSCADTRQSILDKENQMLELINAYRVSKKGKPLTMDEKMRKCMRAHCHHMSVHKDLGDPQKVYYSHDNPEGDGPSARAAKCGTGARGEILHMGSPDPQAIFNSWKASSAHNSIMLIASGPCGIGYYDKGNFWGGLFR